MNVVLVMFKDKQRRDFPLEEDKTILGRRQDCQLRIPTKDVSRQHCAVIIENGTVIAKDLGSSNGTFVNGKRIAESELKAGDRLRVGPVTFVVQVNGRPATIKPEDEVPSETEPTTKSADEEETFDLSEADFDLEDISALDKRKDEDDDEDLP